MPRHYLILVTFWFSRYWHKMYIVNVFSPTIEKLDDRILTFWKRFPGGFILNRIRFQLNCISFSGIATAAIEIDILADDIPEINEMFTVTLTKVEPGDRQRIQNSGNQVNIMIEENDTPGGIFEFAPTMNSTYVVSVGFCFNSWTSFLFWGSIARKMNLNRSS